MKKISFSILSASFFLLGIFFFVEGPWHRQEGRVLGLTSFFPSTASSGDDPSGSKIVMSSIVPKPEIPASAPDDSRENDVEEVVTEEDTAVSETPSAREVADAVLNGLTPDLSSSDDEKSESVVVSVIPQISSEVPVSDSYRVDPPSIPEDVTAEALAGNIVRIRWRNSYGGAGTVRYSVYRDGERIGVAEKAYYDDRSMESGKTYGYSVEAFDDEKSGSGRSAVATIDVPDSDAEAVSPIPVLLTVGRIPSAEKVFVDSDGDGISDAEEERLGTDVLISDSDGDGFSDEDEIRNGFDPLRYSSGDKSDRITFESPKEEVGIQRSEREDMRYVVRSVERVMSRTEDGEDRVATVISGTGTPNSYLTLYIYSDPIVVSVKTDSDGNWKYELDRDLEDGDHEVYVAVTDNLGRITAQSKPMPFVKTAEAVTVDTSYFSDNGAVSEARSVMSRESVRYVAIGLGIASLAIIAFLFVMWRKFPTSF